MTSGTELSQFLRVFLPTLAYPINSPGAVGSGEIKGKIPLVHGAKCQPNKYQPIYSGCLRSGLSRCNWLVSFAPVF